MRSWGTDRTTTTACTLPGPSAGRRLRGGIFRLLWFCRVMSLLLVRHNSQVSVHAADGIFQVVAAAALAAASPVSAAFGDFGLTSIFQPPPVVLVPEHYDGFELRFMRFTIRPAELKLEGALIAAVALYLAVYYLGKRANSTRSVSTCSCLHICRQSSSSENLDVS